MATSGAQTYGVPPPATFYPTFETHTPLGSMAALKGDLIYPVFNIGFFILGVVLVVKFLLSMVGLLQSKLHLLAGEEAADGKRRRRSINTNPEVQDRLDSVTQVVMSALASGQCLQRMTCELGGLVQQYEGGHLLSDIADKVAPEKFRLQVEAFKRAGSCDQYRCGKMAAR